MSEPKNKKVRKYYNNFSKRKQFVIKPGVKGFLCTCNFSEKKCIGEAYNILNLYADKLYPNLLQSNVEEPDNPNVDDVMDELDKEIECMKSELKKVTPRKFQVIESGAKNCIFIQTLIEEPVELASYIAKSIKESKEQQTKYLLRLIPIEVVCKATLTNITEHMIPLLNRHFTKNKKTFGIVLNRRNNNSIDKDMLISKLASMVVNLNPEHKVNLKYPEITILVEISRAWSFLSVLPDYNIFKKYNLVELSLSNQTDHTVTPTILEN